MNIKLSLLLPLLPVVSFAQDIILVPIGTLQTTIVESRPTPTTRPTFTPQHAADMRRFNEMLSKPLYRLFFRKADTNKDKRITVTEARNYARTELEDRDTSRNEPALNVMLKQNPRADINKDGVLTKAELLKFLQPFVDYESGVRN